MTRHLDPASRSQRDALTALASRYHAAGWMLGTSGNLSARFQGTDGPSIVITASGLDKGALGPDDFVEVSLEGALLACGEGRRPSAETSIHVAIYQALPSVNAALHVHTVASTELGRLHGPTHPIDLEDLEMLKGWGMWEPNAKAALPVFTNHAEVPKIAEDLARWLARTPDGNRQAAPAMLIAGHGMTAWGATVDEAHRHVEITEFFCQLGLSRQGNVPA